MGIPTYTIYSLDIVFGQFLWIYTTPMHPQISHDVFLTSHSLNLLSLFNWKYSLTLCSKLLYNSSDSFSQSEKWGKRELTPFQKCQTASVEAKAHTHSWKCKSISLPSIQTNGNLNQCLSVDLTRKIQFIF